MIRLHPDTEPVNDDLRLLHHRVHERRDVFEVLGYRTLLKKVKNVSAL